MSSVGAGEGWVAGTGGAGGGGFPGEVLDDTVLDETVLGAEELGAEELLDVLLSREVHVDRSHLECWLLPCFQADSCHPGLFCQP